MLKLDESCTLALENEAGAREAGARGSDVQMLKLDDSFILALNNEASARGLEFLKKKPTDIPIKTCAAVPTCTQ